MNGYRWSQVEQDGYPAEQWEPGEIILERIDAPAPPGSRRGDGLYRLRLGRFDPASGKRLSRVDETGGFAGDSVCQRQRDDHRRAAARPAAGAAFPGE